MEKQTQISLCCPLCGANLSTLDIGTIPFQGWTWHFTCLEQLANDPAVARQVREHKRADAERLEPYGQLLMF